MSISVWKSSTPRFTRHTIVKRTTVTPTICKFSDNPSSIKINSANQTSDSSYSTESQSSTEQKSIGVDQVSSKSNIKQISILNGTTCIPESNFKQSNEDCSLSGCFNKEKEKINSNKISESKLSDMVLKDKMEDLGINRTKVVVQSLPSIQFGEVSALEQFISPVMKKSTLLSPLRGAVQIETVGNSSNNEKIELYESNNSSSPAVEMRRVSPERPKFYRQFYSRSGIELSTIDHVVAGISNSSPQLLSAVHYILYGSHATFQDEESTERIIKKILSFTGYSFSLNSEIYEKKKKCLNRMPQKMLDNIYRVLLSEMPGPRMPRSAVTKKLLQFLLNPRMSINEEEIKAKETGNVEETEGNETENGEKSENKKEDIDDKLEVNDKNGREIDICEYNMLKENALKGPQPFVILERLHPSVLEIEKFLSDPPEEPSFVPGITPMEHANDQPTYLANGHGIKLKYDKKVVDHIRKARRRIINLLHTLLYGRPGSNDGNRLNILEFSGFPEDNEFLLSRISFLKKVKNVELKILCDIFSIRAKSKTKPGKIKKLLYYLQAPSLRKKSRTVLPKYSRRNNNDNRSERRKDLKTDSIHHLITLNDFDVIRSRVECAPVQELMELNDLLFLKPCDNSEIHQKILSFSPLPNDEYSSAVQCRKTLLHYMNFTTLLKVSRLLDIANREDYRYPEDLSRAIIKFLMEMKPPSKVYKKRTEPNVYQKTFNPQRQSRPHILRLQDTGHGSYKNHWDSGSPAAALQNPARSSEVNFSNSVQDDSSSKYVIHKITDSSYSWTDLSTKETFTVSDANSDEAMSLENFSKHPSDTDLELTVRSILCDNSTVTTLGDFINKVLHHYPEFNLSYRINFIKSMVLQVLQDMEQT